MLHDTELKRNKRSGCVPCHVSWNLLPEIHEKAGGACIWKKCSVCVVLKLYKAYFTRSPFVSLLSRRA